jgi:Flp pilus assembly protein TadG
MWAKTKSIEGEKGQSLVEFALAGLMLMTLTFGMMETGRLVYTASVVQAAAQEGARAAIVEETVIDGTIDSATLASIVTPAVASKLVALDPDQVTLDTAALGQVSEVENVNRPPIVRNTVTVAITYNYQFMIPFIGQLFSSDDTVALRGQASMLVR